MSFLDADHENLYSFVEHKQRVVLEIVPRACGAEVYRCGRTSIRWAMCMCMCVSVLPLFDTVQIHKYSKLRSMLNSLRLTCVWPTPQGYVLHWRLLIIVDRQVILYDTKAIVQSLYTKLSLHWPSWTFWDTNFFRALSTRRWDQLEFEMKEAVIALDLAQVHFVVIYRYSTTSLYFS